MSPPTPGGLESAPSCRSAWCLLFGPGGLLPVARVRQDVFRFFAAVLDGVVVPALEDLLDPLAPHVQETESAAQDLPRVIAVDRQRPVGGPPGQAVVDLASHPDEGLQIPRGGAADLP